MPTAKPTKPSITIPSAFGTSPSNIKTAYTPQELIDGYSASIQQVYDGGNLNWSLDAFFQYHNYTTAIADWLNGLGAKDVPYINSSNQLDSFNLDNMISKWGLFDFKWTDYILDNQDWLRADTFSWQSGSVYTNAYNHLVADISGVSPTTETIGSYTITYYPCADGHKIVTPDQETTVSNIYSATGVAWYYILDTTNQRFKLPRTQWGFVGIRNSVGKFVPQTLPNIKGTFDTHSSYSNIGPQSTFSGAFYRITSGTGTFVNNTTSANSLGFDASKSSSIYQNNAPVQQKATQMYLYFYVGQFSQTATEQTAGLNASLFNGKVDLDFNNMNPIAAAKETIVGWGTPDYSAAASRTVGTEYTAGHNGWLNLFGGGGGNGGAGASGGCNITINGTVFSISNTQGEARTWSRCWFFIPKGTIYKGALGGGTNESLTMVWYPCIGG